jgi:iron complex transport system substrate-binding protein
MPLSRALREGCAVIGVLVFSLIAVPEAHAQTRPRIASINVCTDQLLLTLADPEQIVGLSPYSRDPQRSWAAAEAARYPKLSGEAEDVLVLKPDVVVAGRFTKRATREMLKAEGFRVEEFDAVRSLDDTRRQIIRMGEIVGHPDRSAAAVARIDAALAQAKEAVARKPLHVLPLSRRGWVSGGDSLTSSLLATVGLSNSAAQLGYKLGGFASLEAIVSLKPDLLLLSDGGDFAEDQGTAFLLHPALEELYPPDKRIMIPERLTVCGGPMIADALAKLVSELERVEH